MLYIFIRFRTSLIVTYSHPDKVKLNVNLTIEAVEARFVEITKAYKSYVQIYYVIGLLLSTYCLTISR